MLFSRWRWKFHNHFARFSRPVVSRFNLFILENITRATEKNMPGIAGIIGTGPFAENVAALKTMVKCLEHESFYFSGTYVNEAMGLWIGRVDHRRSFSESMPVWNETKEVCLVFSGEHFADRCEIDHLRARGHKVEFGNEGYLVHLYEENGLKFIEKLNGWFCGLLLDRRRGEAFLFNDRYGMHRVFVHEGRDGLYFSSEAKALLAVLPELREFDLMGMGEFLTCGCTLGSRSLYRGLNILPAGALWVCGHGEVKKKGSYFAIEELVGQKRLDAKEFMTLMVESFGGLVKSYSGGSLPVGISLTGGLDSRMIISGLDMRADEFPCYTFGSMYRDTLDVQVARQVAKACKQPHHVLTLGEEFLREFPRYLEKAVYISDGYIGLSGAAELYVNAMARNLAPVRLTGNYGGELLRGVRAFKYGIPKGAFVKPDLMPYLREARTTFQELEATDPVTFALFRQAPSQGYGRLAIERSQVVPRTPFTDNNLVKLVYQAPPHLLKGEGLSVAIISRYRPSLLEISTARGLLGVGSRFGGAMRQLYCKALIKAEYWSSHGMPNWLAAISSYRLDRSIEKSFLGRDKFQHFRLWTQKRFAGYIADVLHQGGADLEEFFNRRHIESMAREHLAGKKNYLDEIDKLMTIVLAHKNLFGGEVLQSRRTT